VHVHCDSRSDISVGPVRDLRSFWRRDGMLMRSRGGEGGVPLAAWPWSPEAKIGAGYAGCGMGKQSGSVGRACAAPP